MPSYKYFRGIAALFAVFLIFGCGTPPGRAVFDPELPKEKTALVVFGPSIQVRQYNGTNVNKAWYPRGKNRKNTITLPGGPAAIVFEGSYTKQKR